MSFARGSERVEGSPSLPSYPSPALPSSTSPPCIQKQLSKQLKKRAFFKMPILPHFSRTCIFHPNPPFCFWERVDGESGRGARICLPLLPHLLPSSHNKNSGGLDLIARRRLDRVSFNLNKPNLNQNHNWIRGCSNCETVIVQRNCWIRVVLGG